MTAPDIDPGTSLRTKVYTKEQRRNREAKPSCRDQELSHSQGRTNATEAQGQIKQYRRGGQHAHKHLKGKENRSSRTQAAREGKTIGELRHLNAPTQGGRIREEAAMSSPDG